MTVAKDQKPPFEIRGLGEIAIRCNDVPKMAAFYEQVLGLTRMTGSVSDIVFFKIADGFQGHTQILALFSKDATGRPGLHPTGDLPPETGARSSLHHIALNIAFDQQETAIAWFETLGLPVRVEHFGWVGWRGVFTSDPEGNTVELVAYHPDLLE